MDVMQKRGDELRACLENFAKNLATPLSAMLKNVSGTISHDIKLPSFGIKTSELRAIAAEKFKIPLKETLICILGHYDEDNVIVTPQTLKEAGSTITVHQKE
jgi:hypothetical protein